MRALFISLLVVACACRPGEPRSPETVFESAQLAMREGNLSLARDLCDRGIASASQDSESEQIWRLRLLRGEVMLNRLEFSQVESVLNAAIPPGRPFDDLRARQTYLRSRLNATRGRVEDALSDLSSARQLASPGGDVRLDAQILSGQIRMRLGQWSEAEQELQGAIDLAGRMGDRYRQVLAMNNLGMGRLIRGRYDEAAGWFERILSYRDMSRMAVHATALSNVGICYSRLGAFDRALDVQRRAVEFYDRGDPSLQLVQSLGSLGITYSIQGDAPKALAYIQRAVDSAAKANLHAEQARWATNLATAHTRLKQWEEAERVNQTAERLAAASREIPPVYFTLNAAEIAAGRGQTEHARRLYEKTLSQANGVASVQWTAHAGLARAAMAAKQPDRAARHFEAALDTIENTRSALLRTEFKLSFLTQLIEFYQAYVDALVDEGKIERALEIAESSRGRVLAERHGVQPAAKTSAAAMRAVARQTGVVLLSYWLAPERSYLWVVTGDGVRGLQLPPAGEIERLVRGHQAMIDNTLADSLAANDTPGGRLYALLIAPASKWIPEGARAIVVPDGALHRLNFETLPVNGVRSRYWIEDAEIQVAPSLAMLSIRPASEKRTQSMLLIGDPEPREPQFPSLRYASAEMNSIAKQFAPGTVTTLQRDRAVPVAFRNAKPGQFGIIHFTAHASANSESPLDSAVILSGPDQGFKLYARDVAGEPLQAELVTVSACRSAGERTYSGEGLVGFAWAFLRAGSQRVVAGLWDVNDQSTATLMEGMYQRIAAGKPAARSLREAKLSLLRAGGTFAKPYYWGPFQIFTVVP